MKKFKKIKSVIDTKIVDFQNVKNVKIFSSQANGEKSLKVIVNVGDLVKKGQPILEEINGQKILSSISGKVLKIKTTKNVFNEVVESIEIENDNKNETINFSEPIIEKADDLIEVCKKFGLCNDKFFLASFFYKLQTQNELFIDASFGEYELKNYQILVNYKDDILYTIDYILNIFKLHKVNIICNKKNIKFLKKYIDKNNYNFITKYNCDCINLIDIFNIFNAIKGNPQTSIFLQVNGEAIKQNKLVKIPLGTSIEAVIDFVGGFKQNIEEIENFKYTAMLAYNDEIELKNKIKICKNKEDKCKLKKLLNEKKSEAKENIYKKIGEYHNKYLTCLSACLINNIKDKKYIKTFDNFIQNDVYSIIFLSYKEFR